MLWNLGRCVNMPAEFKCYSRCSWVLWGVILKLASNQPFHKNKSHSISEQNEASLPEGQLHNERKLEEDLTCDEATWLNQGLGTRKSDQEESGTKIEEIGNFCEYCGC